MYQTQGLKTVDSVAQRHNLSGVYSPLYRLFEVTDPKFNTAADLTAGNGYAYAPSLYTNHFLVLLLFSLFHFVVDTNETSSKVLDQLCSLSV